MPIWLALAEKKTNTIILNMAPFSQDFYFFNGQFTLYLCFSSQENALQWCHQQSIWPISPPSGRSVKKKHTITLPQLLVFYITIDLSVLQVAEVKNK